MTRRSIELESFAHRTPIPCASRVGPLLASSVIPPFEPFSRDLPDTLEAQVANLFVRAGEILAAGGATWTDVVKMTFFVRDLAHRNAIDGPWEQHFPDPASRPARHTQIGELGGPQMVTCDLLAWVGP